MSDNGYTSALIPASLQTIKISGTFVEYDHAGIVWITFKNNLSNLAVTQWVARRNGGSYTTSSLTVIKTIIGIKF